ncbi:hypothetical protein [Streptomyces kronopolitis]|uniref:hypothetical protein n=1 Tax=Streptomyces kronopolitis TaxID=1612435 RepID=UPI0020BEF3D4|nr:hypothetical protein [Streptomyces kronopolitis]MCL6302838.1 hypothetical protein [Streptomyces kronopolitis]
MLALFESPEVLAVLVGAPLVLVTAWASYATGSKSARGAVDAVRRQSLEQAYREVMDASLTYQSYCSNICRETRNGQASPDIAAVTLESIGTVGKIQNASLLAGDLVHDAAADLQEAVGDLGRCMKQYLQDPDANADALNRGMENLADMRGAFMLAARVEISFFPRYSLGSKKRLSVEWSAGGNDGNDVRRGRTGPQ